jgi:hypothetical protein
MHPRNGDSPGRTWVKPRKWSTWRGTGAVSVGVWVAVVGRNVLAVTAERQLVVVGRWAKRPRDDGFYSGAHNNIRCRNHDYVKSSTPCALCPNGLRWRSSS